MSDRETERDFATFFEDWLNLKGYRFAHFRPARTAKGWRTAVAGYAGFPDYCIVTLDNVAFVELKSEDGRLSNEQREWHKALVNAGAWIYVFRPSQRELVMETFP